MEIPRIRIKKHSNHELSAEIAFADELRNGSGFCEELYRKIKEERFLHSVVSGQLEPVKNYFQREHRDKCITSCYDCLQAYDNMAFHSILDWRLGISLLKTFLGEQYLYNSSQSVEMVDWVKHTTALTTRIAKWKNWEVKPIELEMVASKFLLLDNKIGGRVGIVHPLWSTTHPANWLANAFVNNELFEGVKFIDSFEAGYNWGKVEAKMDESMSEANEIDGTPGF